MTTRSGPVRAWWARAGRWVLQALEAMAGLDVAGSFSGCAPPYLVVSPGWVTCTQWVDEPLAALCEGTCQVVAERLRVLTPADPTPERVLGDRHRTGRPPFTALELAHLHFVRWLHQTGRVIC